ncbi:unnamed protein product [Rangifer tarandus platyrhynchus]|uniref:Uncharacterized protein n=2 Tax=Rangifer tarandus platyrhynchus TaxID=3082113 RepID=A0ABN8YE53_RANTA|nr:unnamed protein product [Rangifer tarandus platyrhynchus]
MPRRKGEVASRAKANTGERRGPGEGAAVGVTESAPHKEETSAPDVTAEEEEAGLETSVFCDNTALTDPRERPRERPLGDRRVVAGQGSPPLEVCNDSDSNFCSQKTHRAKEQRAFWEGGWPCGGAASSPGWSVSSTPTVAWMRPLPGCPSRGPSLGSGRPTAAPSRRSFRAAPPTSAILSH